MDRGIFNGIERRRFFRLSYPDNERPHIAFTKGSFKISEISEGGLKFSSRQAGIFRNGEEIRGKLRLRDGEVLDIQGRILRKQLDEIVIQPRELIPGRIIQAEQRFIVQKYPKLRQLWSRMKQ